MVTNYALKETNNLSKKRDCVDGIFENHKTDLLYRLTANIADASEEESAEILDEIEALSDDDLEIAASEIFIV